MREIQAHIERAIATPRAARGCLKHNAEKIGASNQSEARSRKGQSTVDTQDCVLFKIPGADCGPVMGGRPNLLRLGPWILVRLRGPLKSGRYEESRDERP